MRSIDRTLASRVVRTRRAHSRLHLTWPGRTTPRCVGSLEQVESGANDQRNGSSSWAMSPGCSATACTSGRDSNRWTGSKRSARSQRCTASDSSDSSSWFPVSSAPIYRVALLHSPRTATSQPERSRFSRCSLSGRDHAVQASLPAVAGELGDTYVIPIIYVPLLLITHVAAFYLLMRPTPRHASA